MIVGIGGAMGAAARYLLGFVVLRHYLEQKFPVGTFTINVLGCLAGGILSGFVIVNDAFSHEIRLFLFTGILGGFTTFSAFSLEAVMLSRRGEVLTAGSYVVLSVACGLAAFWIGTRAVSLMGLARVP